MAEDIDALPRERATGGRSIDPRITPVRDLEARIAAHSANIAVIGLGYLGLPMASEFGHLGFPVIGIDVDKGRLAALERGESYIPDVEASLVQHLTSTGKLTVSADYDQLLAADIVFVCVPTPFTPNKSPDISYVVSAAQGIRPRLRPGQLVVLQSTTHPGTTEEDVLPVLEQSGLKAGVDFHLAFSPERINPGDRLHTVRTMPKVVGGLTPRCAMLTKALLTEMNPQVHLVSAPRVAEMSKLLENIFRSVNVALVSELAMLAERMGIDIWEVIEAASTKPFGFMPFYPSAGVGGHCIPVDPFYLSWKAREYDFHTKFIELAAEVNQSMPYHVLGLTSSALNSIGQSLKGANVLVLGVAFKKDIDDARNSAAERVIELLLDAGANVRYNDPYVPSFPVGRDVFYREQRVLASVSLDQAAVSNSHCVLIVSAHSCYDYQWIVDHAQVVVDTANATRNVVRGRERVVRLGAPKVSASRFDTD